MMNNYMDIVYSYFKKEIDYVRNKPDIAPLEITELFYSIEEIQFKLLRMQIDIRAFWFENENIIRKKLHKENNNNITLDETLISYIEKKQPYYITTKNLLYFNKINVFDFVTYERYDLLNIYDEKGDFNSKCGAILNYLIYIIYNEKLIRNGLINIVPLNNFYDEFDRNDLKDKLLVEIYKELFGIDYWGYHVYLEDINENLDRKKINNFMSFFHKSNTLSDSSEEINRHKQMIYDIERAVRKRKIDQKLFLNCLWLINQAFDLYLMRNKISENYNINLGYRQDFLKINHFFNKFLLKKFGMNEKMSFMINEKLDFINDIDIETVLLLRETQKFNNFQDTFINTASDINNINIYNDSEIAIYERELKGNMRGFVEGINSEYTRLKKKRVVEYSKMTIPLATMLFMNFEEISQMLTMIGAIFSVPSLDNIGENLDNLDGNIENLRNINYKLNMFI